MTWGSLFPAAVENKPWTNWESEVFSQDDACSDPYPWCMLCNVWGNESHITCDKHKRNYWCYWNEEQWPLMYPANFARPGKCKPPAGARVAVIPVQQPTIGKDKGKGKPTWGEDGKDKGKDKGKSCSHHGDWQPTWGDDGKGADKGKGKGEMQGGYVSARDFNMLWTKVLQQEDALGRLQDTVCAQGILLQSVMADMGRLLVLTAAGALEAEDPQNTRQTAAEDPENTDASQLQMQTLAAAPADADASRTSNSGGSGEWTMTDASSANMTTEHA